MVNTRFIRILYIYIYRERKKVRKKERNNRHINLKEKNI